MAMLAIDIHDLTEIRAFMDRSPLVPTAVVIDAVDTSANSTFNIAATSQSVLTATLAAQITSLTTSQEGEPSSLLTTVARFSPRIPLLTQSQEGEPSGALTPIAPSASPQSFTGLEQAAWVFHHDANAEKGGWWNPFEQKASEWSAALSGPPEPFTPRKVGDNGEQGSPSSSPMPENAPPASPLRTRHPASGAESVSWSCLDESEHETEPLAISTVGQDITIRAPRPQNRFTLPAIIEKWSTLLTFSSISNSVSGSFGVLNPHLASVVDLALEAEILAPGSVEKNEEEEGESSWYDSDLLEEYSDDEAAAPEPRPKPVHPLLLKFQSLRAGASEELRRLDVRISDLEREAEEEEEMERHELGFLADIEEEMHPALRRHSLPASGPEVVGDEELFADLDVEIDDTALAYIYTPTPSNEQDGYPSPSTPRNGLVGRWLSSLVPREDSPTLGWRSEEVSPPSIPRPCSRVTEVEVSRFSISSPGSESSQGSIDSASMYSRGIDECIDPSRFVPWYHEFDMGGVEPFMAPLSQHSSPSASAFEPFYDLDVEALLSSPGPTFSDHDPRKDYSRSHLRLSPRPRNDDCFCEHCEEYFAFPLFRRNGIDHHHFSQWCWCCFCVQFRRKREEQEAEAARQRAEEERKVAERRRREESETRRANLLQELRGPSWLTRPDIPNAINDLLKSPHPTSPLSTGESAPFVRRAIDVIGGASMASLLKASGNPTDPQSRRKRTTSRLLSTSTPAYPIKLRAPKPSSISKPAISPFTPKPPGSHPFSLGIVWDEEMPSVSPLELGERAIVFNPAHVTTHIRVKNARGKDEVAGVDFLHRGDRALVRSRIWVAVRGG